MSKNKLVEQIQKDAYRFFMENTNYDEESPGYGLVLDHTEDEEKSSIAGVGFGLSAYVIGVSNGYISYEEAKDKVIKTLKTLKNNVSHYKGFFAHFLDIKTALRYEKCEYSTIDTALALNGVITVDSYFQDPEITKLSKAILDRVDFEMLFHRHEGKKRLYMAYNPDRSGDYVVDKPGFIHHWGMFSEQLMMYAMIAGLGYNKKTSIELYEGFEREQVTYKGHTFYLSPGNTLFVYQFPLAWLDLENVYDKDGINWFLNAKEASLAHRAFCIAHQKHYKTFGQYSFGLTASYTPKGYYVANALPNKMNKYYTDGTIAPSAMIGSLIFIEDIVLRAIHLMSINPIFKGKYGFVGAYNFEKEPWVSDRDYALDKGLELLMSNAYLSKDVMNAYMKHDIIKKGMAVLSWTTKTV